MWLIACAPAPEGESPDSGAQPDTGRNADTGVVARATEGSLALSFALDASGAGSDRLGSIEVLDAAGGLELNGAFHLAVAYQDHDWVETGYHLYDLLSVDEDGSNLAVTYLYCEGNGLPYAYTESFTDPLDWEVTSGSCEGVATPTAARASLPALRELPEPIATGVVFEDGELAEGQLTMEGVTREWIPFNTVDCSECPGGPWYELHSMLAGESDACFTILYLYPDDPTFAQAEYTLCLPSLDRPVASVAANWSGAPAARPGPPRPPPPPR